MQYQCARENGVLTKRHNYNFFYYRITYPSNTLSNRFWIFWIIMWDKMPNIGYAFLFRFITRPRNPGSDVIMGNQHLSHTTVEPHYSWAKSSHTVRPNLKAYTWANSFPLPPSHNEPEYVNAITAYIFWAQFAKMCSLLAVHYTRIFMVISQLKFKSTTICQ